MNTWHPTRRYSAVAVLSEDLDRVVLVRKLRPDRQAGKANLPGGKVEAEKDYIDGDTWEGTFEEACDLVYRRCAVRELREKTSLNIVAAALQLFCRLRYKSRKGDDAECCFYAVKGDVDAARTMESERVFVSDTLLLGLINDEDCMAPTMPNLLYLIAMARQCLRGESAGSWPLTVYENGAV